jgi:adenylate kinase family enzyme
MATFQEVSKTAKLIVLRGNSGSGKSSVARELQQRMGYGTALIEQDYIRRKLLRERDKPNQPNIELIALNVTFALSCGYNVILEGILPKDHYGSMLSRILNDHIGETYVYYFDIPFDETLNRHKTKPNAHEFGEVEMREWFREHDVLNVEDERIIPQELTFEQTVVRILDDVSL